MARISVRRCVGVCGFLLAVSVALSARAEIVSSEIAARAAAKWLETNFVAKQSLDECVVDGIAVRDALYVVSLLPSGYIVLPTTDLLAPIISFSKNPFVEPDAGSPFFALLKASNEQAITAEAKGGERHARWVKLIGTRDGSPVAKPKLAGAEINVSEMTEYVAPFLTAHWNQWQPWNDFSPQLGEEEDSAYRNRVPCGCVATAAAQHLYYWKWPYCDGEARTVTHSFKHGGVTESVDLRYDGRLPFDWDAMVDSYTGFSGDSRGKVKESYRFPVARLVFWVDGALSMAYAQGGSGANIGAMGSEISPWFSSIKSCGRSDYENFAAICRAELKDKAVVGITVPGHQVVGHGWASDGTDDYLYLNYGWSGSSDGWYLVSDESSVVSSLQYFRPRKKAYVEQLPAVSESSVTLKWHVPDYYQNKITGFTINGLTDGASVGSFTENFSSYPNGCVHWIPDQANELELAGVYGLTTRSVVTYDASVRYGLDGRFSLEMSLDYGPWQSVLDWNYGNGAQEDRKYRAFLGSFAGHQARFRFVNKRTGGRYYNYDDRLLDFDNFKLTDVVVGKNLTPIKVASTARSYTLSNLTAGANYDFTVTPTIEGAEPSNGVGTRIAGSYLRYLPGVETYAAKSYSYATSNAAWSLNNATYSSGTIATEVWKGKINYRVAEGKVGSSTTLSFKWTSNGYYSAGSSYDTLKVEFKDFDNNVTSLYSITNSAKQTTAKSVSVSLKKVQDKKGLVTISFGHSGSQNSYGGMKFTDVKISNVLEPVLPKLASETRQAKVCDQPAILKVIGPDGTEFDEGFYRDLVNGEDYFDVEVNAGTTQLNAYPSHLFLLSDEQVSVEKIAPTKYRVTMRPAERAFNRTRLIMTLEAINANGDKAYKDLSLRFDAEEKILAIDNKRTFNAYDAKPYKTYLFEGSIGMSGTANTFIDAPFGKAVVSSGETSGAYTSITFNFGTEFTIVATARSSSTDNSPIFSLGDVYAANGLALASGGSTKVTLSRWTTANTAHSDLVTASVSDAVTKFHTYVIRVKNRSAELWVDGVKKGTGTLAGLPEKGLEFFGVYSGVRKSGFVKASGAAVDEFYIYQSAIPDAMIKEYSNLRKTSDSTYASFVTNEGWEMAKSWVTKYYPGEKYYLARVNREAANGRRIWECYAAGLDPTDPKSEFKISFELVDGKPVIKADPDLGSARTYTLYGSNDLKTWTQATDSTAKNYHYFKVSVDVK